MHANCTASISKPQSAVRSQQSAGSRSVEENVDGSSYCKLYLQLQFQSLTALGAIKCMNETLPTILYQEASLPRTLSLTLALTLGLPFHHLHFLCAPNKEIHSSAVWPQVVLLLPPTCAVYLSVACHHLVSRVRAQIILLSSVCVNVSFPHTLFKPSRQVQDGAMPQLSIAPLRSPLWSSEKFCLLIKPNIEHGFLSIFHFFIP